MGDPQVENGYTRIANELLDHLITVRIPGEVMQVFLVVLRHTYGFNLVSAPIPFKSFLKTGLLPPNICRARKILESCNMIQIKEAGNKFIYRINKKYSTWVVDGKMSMSVTRVINIDNGIKAQSVINTDKSVINIDKSVIDIDNSNKVKDNLKDNIKDMCNKPKKPSVSRVSKIHFEKLWAQYPKKIGKKEALKHYNASVKTEEDRLRIEKAMDNFLVSRHGANRDEVEYIQHAKTWFNNWEDWIEDPVTNEGEQRQLRNKTKSIDKQIERITNGSS